MVHGRRLTFVSPSKATHQYSLCEYLEHFGERRRGHKLGSAELDAVDVDVSESEREDREDAAALASFVLL
jgi:hypothetical protein